MLSIVTATLIAGSVLCSGIDIVGPKKTVTIPPTTSVEQLKKKIHTAGLVLVFVLDTISKSSGNYYVIDTAGNNNRNVAYFNFTNGKLFGAVTDSVFKDKSAAEDYAADLAAALEKKLGQHYSVDSNDQAVHYNFPTVRCGKRNLLWSVDLHFLGSEDNSVATVTYFY